MVKKKEVFDEPFSLEELEVSGVERPKEEAFAHLEARYRSAKRKKVRLRCDVEIILRNNRLVDVGRATIFDLSASGAFLSNFSLRHKVFPVKPFLLRLKFRNKDFRGITLLCEPVRIAIMNGNFAFGVRFKDIMVRVDRR